MRARVIRSTIILISAIILFSGGVTMAWFTDTATPEPLAMKAGTVDLDVLPTTITPQPQNPTTISWTPGTTKNFVWTIKNIGSKKIMLRARPVVGMERKDETAWGEGRPFNPDGQGNWAMYFTYNVGSGKQSTRLLAGQHDHCGDVEVWLQDNALHVKYKLKAGYKLLETHLAVATDVDDIPTNANGNPPPGQFPFKKQHNYVSEYTYVIPGSYTAGQTLMLAAHAVVSCQTDSTINNISWHTLDSCPYMWAKGEPETVNNHTVTWWYHSQPIATTGEITLCLTGYLPENASGGTYTVHLEVEAIQASHHASDIWPHP
ncbi:MAG: CalY family protein [Firmicutes bacterium]|nr:CalY family protein [Bacillota bacterium]